MISENTQWAKELLGVAGLNAGVWTITLTNLSHILSAVFSLLSIAYLIWRWNKKGKD